MTIPLHDPLWGNEYGLYTTECNVSEKPTHSRLLDAKGNPMKYEKLNVGFDLRKTSE